MADDTPRAAKGAKSEQSRARLIQAAIDCIGRYGYAGATTDVIARAAGMTRGPLQYYFTDRAGLIATVFEQLQSDVLRRYREATEGMTKGRAFVNALLEVNYEFARSNNHYAMLEILIAMRSDPDLALRVEPLLRRNEEEIDKRWASNFPPTRPGAAAELITMRYVMIAMIRGLAINSLTFRDPGLFDRQFDLIRRIAFQIYDET